MRYNKDIIEGEVAMKPREYFPALVLLVFLIGLVPAVRSSVSAPRVGQNQEERSKFYAREVVFEQNVKNARDSLREPDGRFAEIGVGGQIVILMEKRIIPSGASDDGLVVCQGEASFGLEGWFLQAGTEEAPQYAWMLLVRGRSPGGFRLTAAEMAGGTLEGSSGVNMIRISNNDTKPILVDAVVGYGAKEDRPPALVVRRPL
jgi:hypothetical protein